MNLIKTLVPMMIVASTAGASAQSAADSAAIRATALDYVEGWYTADAARMERALHPELAKRIVNTHPQNGSNSLGQQSALDAGSGHPQWRRQKDTAGANAEGRSYPRHLSERRECKGRHVRLDRLHAHGQMEGSLGHRERALGIEAPGRLKQN
ncbi:MAG: nuclear transport factor 2 family protein [Gemmatimonadota bacterium]